MVRIRTDIRLGVFEVWIEVEFIIGICGQQKNDFIRIADNEFAISRVQASSFVYGLYAESKFHLVVFEATGIEQTIGTVCFDITYGFRVAAIAEYQVLHAGTVGCELQYHHAVGVGNEVFTLVVHFIFAKTDYCHGRVKRQDAFIIGHTDFT